MKVFVLLCFVVAVVAVAAVNAACTHTTVNVNTTNDLKKALLSAKPGFEIVVGAGIYEIDESFSFGRSGEVGCPITLSCAEYDTAHLSGTFMLDSISNVALINISITGHDDYCVVCSSSKSVLFDSVSLFHSKSVGMSIQKSSNITVRNSDFVDMGPNALLLSETNDSFVESCLFGDQIDYVAIWLNGGSSNNVIRSNVFYGNESYTKSSPSWIIIDDKSANNHVIYNSFVNPDNAPMAGGVTCLLSANSNVLKENFMVLNDDAFGFLIQGGDQKVCASNRVLGGHFTNDDSFIDNSC